MAKKYQITAEVKKEWQEWGSVILHRDSRMTERGLIKTLATVKNSYGKFTVNVQVRNFQCVRMY
ncbi:hypothetical protein [Gilliamella apicola]|uniref:hypothetical protein n=1 Tax=Gilliamella apicola TaxID=1196095 RepID=UPI00080DEA30|nr:hypothetical protein [Gilliamella apicola]OCG12657.1 hypothetical protein A9G14_04715 [Gilliamella apicola]